MDLEKKIIDLSQILDIQKKLNNDIYETQNVNFENTKNKLHLALMAELMELCNETRCFNYWSLKKRSTDDVILEEYADVLCFILTECIYYEVDLIEVQIDRYSTIDDNEIITLSFIELIKLYAEIDSKKTCLMFLKHFIELGYKLGYEFEEIKEAYKKKCEKNHNIQKQIREINDV